ncbi:MAG: 16S rRNA (guanine(527)-N(7))-methyltransferase RsmG [Prevotella sp.]|nr:16S rRNA (guanine(527)-N(7))-methyltransferase RsmG [Prevotella sp.]
MELIKKYFPNLTQRQTEQLEQLSELYHSWNDKINVISRRDIDNLYLHHVLHSMAIAKVLNFRPGTRILDLGTGGGFPGVPLAIMFPECEFTLIDGTGKKILVASEVAKAIGLGNCTAIQRRGEEEQGKYHFVVSRAVMPLPELARLVKKNIAREQINALPNGLICLKGGDLQEETRSVKKIVSVQPISQWFDDDWFKGKYVLYLPM